MSFLDKAINKTKLVAKNVDSKLGEGVDVSKTKSKINDEKSKIEKNLKLIGELYYAFVKGTDPDAQTKIDEAIAKIEQSTVDIEEYERLIDDIKVKGKEERENFKIESENEE